MSQRARHERHGFPHLEALYLGSAGLALASVGLILAGVLFWVGIAALAASAVSFAGAISVRWAGLSRYNPKESSDASCSLEVTRNPGEDSVDG